MGMTREEIIAKWDGMAPRERDAWVAEVVFGWEWRAPDEYSIGWYERVGNPPFYDRIYTGYGEEWSPTTDISAAWTVLTYCDKYARVTWRHADVWYAEIGTVFVEESTAPEAIGLAAILAKLLTQNTDDTCARCGISEAVTGYEWCAECRPKLLTKG